MASNVENVLNWCESNGAGSSACGYGGVQSTSCWKMSLRNFSFSRNTSNCEYGYVKCDVYEQTDWTNLGWASTSGNYRLSSVAASNSHGQGAHVDHWGSKGVKCHPSVTYSATLSNVTVGVTAIDNQLWYGYIWGFTPGSYDYQYLNTATYNMADDMRITAPSGLTVSFPSAADGTVSASISYWGMSSAATNMTGTPTTYPNATYWNWALDLLDQYGNTLAHKCSNTGETKSKSWTGNSFYTASALEGTAAATSSKYTMQANAAYKLKVVVNNSFNQSVAQESNLMYSLPPTPTLTIDSCIYVPTTKDATLTFSWSKAADAGALTETIKYDVYDANGTYYKSGVVLATVTDGTAQTGTITVTGLPSGEQYTVKVTLSTTAGTTSATDSTYAPVANAAFLGFDWDELRRTCTIRAEAPGAANCRIQAGYQANVYDIGDKLTPGQIGTLVVKDLDHGDGEILYLQAIPEASNGYQYENEIAKISVPIPNPILGLRIPECESEAEPEYIVDILEKKPDCSLTQRWQNGDRIVVKDPCDPGEGSGGAADTGCPAKTSVFPSVGTQQLFTRLERGSDGSLEFTWNPALENTTLTSSQLSLNSTTVLYGGPYYENSNACFKADWDLPDYTVGTIYEMWLEVDGDMGDTGLLMYIRYNNSWTSGGSGAYLPGDGTHVLLRIKETTDNAFTFNTISRSSAFNEWKNGSITTGSGVAKVKIHYKKITPPEPTDDKPVSDVEAIIAAEGRPAIYNLRGEAKLYRGTEDGLQAGSWFEFDMTPEMAAKALTWSAKNNSGKITWPVITQNGNTIRVDIPNNSPKNSANAYFSINFSPSIPSSETQGNSASTAFMLHLSENDYKVSMYTYQQMSYIYRDTDGLVKYSKRGDAIMAHNNVEFIVPPSDWGTLYSTSYPSGKELTQADWNVMVNIPNMWTSYAFSFGTVHPSSITRFEIGSKPTTLPKYFMRYWYGLKGPVVIPENITSIPDSDFLAGCSAVVNDVTFPSTLTNINAYNFMRSMSNFTGTIHANCPATVFDTSDFMSIYALSASSDTDAQFTPGVDITGPYAADWKALFPDTNSPMDGVFRKLNLV